MQNRPTQERREEDVGIWNRYECKGAGQWRSAGQADYDRLQDLVYQYRFSQTAFF